MSAWRQVTALALVASFALGCVEDESPSPSPSASGPSATGPLGVGGRVATPRPRIVLPTPSPTPEPTARRYRIKPGDSLAGIAREFKTTMKRIMAANPRIVDPNRIEAGDVIVIPPKGVDPRRVQVDGLEDLEDDAVDASGTLVRTPGYVDIAYVEASVAGGSLTVTLTLLGVPPTVAPTSEAVTYQVVIDSEDDPEADWLVNYSNTVTPGSSYDPSLEDLGRGRDRKARRFPGEASTFGSTVEWTVPLRALRSPSLLRIGVRAESVFLPGRPTEERITDVLPSPLWPADNAQWLEISAG